MDRMNLLLIATTMVGFTCSPICLATDGDGDLSPEQPPGTYEEQRAFEALIPSEGIYEFSLESVSGIVDHATSKAYLNTPSGMKEVAISDDALANAGMTRAQFNYALTSAASTYEVQYDLNVNMARDDWNGTSLEVDCSAGTCSSWGYTEFGDNGNYGMFDRFSTSGLTPWGWGTKSPEEEEEERQRACRDVRDYSERGLIDAAGVGLACASVATVVGAAACAAAIAKLIHTTYKRQKAQRKCKYGY